MRASRVLATAAATALAASFGLATASPATAVTPAEAVATTSGYGGYSSGTTTYVNAANVSDPDLAKVSLAQSAAAVSVREPLVTEDLLHSSILTTDAAGKNAYGHGAAANVGLLQAENAPPQVALSTAEALSPPPSTEATTDELLTLPLAPVATAQLLPSSAQARTTSVAGACVAGDDGLISAGTAEAADAQLLSPGADQNVISIGGSISTSSQTGLLPPVAGAAGFGLESLTTQSLAPITLFQGIPGAETTIEVLHQLRLSSRAGGVAGSGAVFYGFIDAEGEPVPDSEPVLLINGTGLTSEQVLGGDGIQLSLGLADVFIGAPAHGLDDDPTSDPAVAADGTSTAAAADLIRVKVPGTVTTGTTTPVAEDSPLAPVLNPVLTPVIEGLEPVLTALQQGLAGAGLDVADVRYGHLEALATVPAGGIVCSQVVGGSDNPFSEARKDVSAFAVAPGATFEYTVRFPNRGTAPVTDVVVTDTFTGGPPLLEFVSSDPAPTSRDGNVLTYEIGTVEPGEYVDISLVFRVPANAPAGTQYRNDARISGTYQDREVTEDVSVVGPTVVEAPRGDCDVSRSTKYASNVEVVTGQTFAYYVNVANSGGETCTGVTVTDTLREGVEYVSCSETCTVAGRTVTWKLGTLVPGASATVSVVVRTVATAGRLPNDADIGTAEGSTANPQTPGPAVTDVSVPAPGRPAGCPATGCPAVAGSVLPRTGPAALLPALGGLALAGGLIVRRRRF